MKLCPNAKRLWHMTLLLLVYAILKRRKLEPMGAGTRLYLLMFGQLSRNEDRTYPVKEALKLLTDESLGQIQIVRPYSSQKP